MTPWPDGQVFCIGGFLKYFLQVKVRDSVNKQDDNPIKSPVCYTGLCPCHDRLMVRLVNLTDSADTLTRNGT
mgnify:CR=1 FL=1